jgi:ribosomal protein S18 acetylase RimI-like enzyme
MSRTPLRVERGVIGAEPPLAWTTVQEAVGSSAVDRTPAGLHTLIAFRGSEPFARLGFGTRSGYAGAPGVTGYVGWYEALDGEAGAELLRQAAAEMFGSGAERVVGPLNGSTWERYRLSLPRDAEIADGRPFLSEPSNPPVYPEHFARAGYRPELEYESRIVRDPRPDLSLAPAATRLRERGIEIGGIDPLRYDEEIRSIHELSLVAFAGNPYYTPIGFAEFSAMYSAVRPLVDPALVRLARDAEGRLLGYVFAYSDPLAPGRRIILKTLASHPAARGLGLGGLLTDAVNRVAAQREAQVIHALMHLSNFSEKISRRSESEHFRSYRLYAAERP